MQCNQFLNLQPIPESNLDENEEESLVVLSNKEAQTLLIEKCEGTNEILFKYLEEIKNFILKQPKSHSYFKLFF